MSNNFIRKQKSCAKERRVKQGGNKEYSLQQSLTDWYQTFLYFIDVFLRTKKAMSSFIRKKERRNGHQDFCNQGRIVTGLIIEGFD